VGCGLWAVGHDVMPSLQSLYFPNNLINQTRLPQ